MVPRAALGRSGIGGSATPALALHSRANSPLHPPWPLRGQPTRGVALGKISTCGAQGTQLVADAIMAIRLLLCLAQLLRVVSAAPALAADADGIIRCGTDTPPPPPPAAPRRRLHDDLHDKYPHCAGDHSDLSSIFLPDNGVFRVSVVVHVITCNRTGALSLDPEKCISDQVAQLNAAYRASSGKDLRGTDAGIEFELATSDPSGAPTKGFELVENCDYFNELVDYTAELQWVRRATQRPRPLSVSRPRPASRCTCPRDSIPRRIQSTTSTSTQAVRASTAAAHCSAGSLTFHGRRVRPSCGSNPVRAAD